MTDQARTPAPRDLPDGDQPTQVTGPTASPEPAPPPPHPGRLPPGTRLGDWVIEGVIGVGGMGTVYAATHAVIGKRAAIKVVRSELCANPQTAERFVYEARVVNQIGHAGIVDIFHIGQLEDGRPYLVMELLLGQTLGRRIADGRVLPPEAIDILLQVCDALGAAHAHGVVHRDLKPDNVVLVDTPGGTQIKLVDWGIAKAMDQRDGTLTTTGMMVGTPQYMSPEQARGRLVDGRSDIYSLGAIAYELFLEGPPFVADNIADLVTMHLREPPAPPSELWPDIPPELERLLIAMLAKAAEDRPTLDQVVATLRRVRDQLESQNGWRRSAQFARTTPPPLAVLDRAPTWSEHHPIVAEPDGNPPRPLSTRRRGRASAAHPGAVAAPIVADHSTDGDVFTKSGMLSAVQPPRRAGRAFGALSLFVGAAAVAFLVLSPEVVAPAADAARSSADEVVPVPATPTAAVGPAAYAPDAGVGLAVEPAPAPEQAPPAATATLDLRVAPASARVSIDGARAALDDGRLIRDVEPGSLAIVVEASGHRTYRRTLDVATGTVLLEVRLEPERRASPRRSSPRAERRRRAPAIDPDGTIDPFE